MSTPEQMAEALRRAIREKVIEPGSLLIQEDLARRFQVSRNPVREALRILASEGLVIMSPGGRASVRLLTVEDLQEIYDLRITLESMLAQAIVDEARQRDVKGLRRQVETMMATSELPEWLRLNYDFHIRLYQLADRPHTLSICANLLSLTQPYSQENIEVLGGWKLANSEHQQMVEAIDDGDAERLASVLRGHLATARDHLTAARQGDGETTAGGDLTALLAPGPGR